MVFTSLDTSTIWLNSDVRSTKLRTQLEPHVLQSRTVLTVTGELSSLTFANQSLTTSENGTLVNTEESPERPLCKRKSSLEDQSLAVCTPLTTSTTTTREEFTVRRLFPLELTTLFLLSDGEPTPPMETTGSLETLGVPGGENLDISESPWVTETSESVSMPVTGLLHPSPSHKFHSNDSFIAK